MSHFIGLNANDWAMDEAGKNAGQDRFGVLVFTQVQPVQTPQGQAMMPVWFVALTMRSPLLGKDPLVHCMPVCPVEPVEDKIRAEVRNGIGQLRDLHRKQLAPSNGS